MPNQALAPYRNPRDLLRRFTPTPLKARVGLDFAHIELETNDPSFVAAWSGPAATPPSVPPDSSNSLPTCFWKIVRDPDVHHRLAEPSFVDAGDLAVCTMGPACLMAADRGRKELLAFIGSEVDARAFQELILPAFCRLTEFVTNPASAPLGNEEASVSVRDQCNA